MAAIEETIRLAGYEPIPSDDSPQCGTVEAELGGWDRAILYGPIGAGTNRRYEIELLDTSENPHRVLCFWTVPLSEVGAVVREAVRLGRRG